jgi:hypothetical protein
MKKMAADNWIEVLKTGTHTASSGEKVNIDDAYLQRVAVNYDRSHHDAPLVLGHPADNSPALGWTEALKAEGGKLLAKVKPAESLREWVRDGLFKKVSASIYQDLDGRGPYLRHIGFLGATPPSIKGLSPFAFDDGDAVWVEFGGSTDQPINRSTEKKRSNEMDEGKIRQMLTEFADGIKNAITATLGKLKPAGTEPGGGNPDVGAQIAEAVKTATADLSKNFSEQVKALETQLGEQKKQLSAADEATRRAGIRSFADRLKAAGKWVPALDRLHLVEFMETLPSGEGAVIEFSETTEKDGKTTTTTVKQSPLQFFQEFLEKLPKIVELRELTADVKSNGSSKVIAFSADEHGRRAENVELAERTTQIQREKKLSFEEAATEARAELGASA